MLWNLLLKRRHPDVGLGTSSLIWSMPSRDFGFSSFTWSRKMWLRNSGTKFARTTHYGFMQERRRRLRRRHPAAAIWMQRPQQRLWLLRRLLCDFQQSQRFLVVLKMFWLIIAADVECNRTPIVETAPNKNGRPDGNITTKTNLDYETKQTLGSKLTRSEKKTWQWPIRSPQNARSCLHTTAARCFYCWLLFSPIWIDRSFHDLEVVGAFLKMLVFWLGFR